EQRQGVVTVRFHPETRVPPERLVEFVRQTPGARLEPGGALRFSVARVAAGAGSPLWLEELRKRLLALGG
ncbi:MAG: hypothetical protein ACREMG_12020, partial [Gemmatimonadales bacterium]